MSENPKNVVEKSKKFKKSQIRKSATKLKRNLKHNSWVGMSKMAKLSAQRHGKIKNKKK